MAFLQYCKLFSENVHNPFKKNEIKIACILFENEGYIKTVNDEVYHLVNNSRYKIDKLCGKDVIEFRYGYADEKPSGYHILALTKHGMLYGWGNNKFKQVRIIQLESTTEKINFLDFKSKKFRYL